MFASTADKEANMPTRLRLLAPTIVLAVGIALMATGKPALAASAAEIDATVDDALKTLYATNGEAKMLAAKAKGVLVFPSVVKVGFVGGAQNGEGALRRGGKTVGYYSTVAGSYGLQAGIQKFAYAMFFMTARSLRYLDASHGWEVGTGPSVVIVDSGKAQTMTTSTLQDAVYAFIFDQKGLMAGLGLQGSKITKIQK
jgi:lipid-binding SYLF domain-containing protein